MRALIVDDEYNGRELLSELLLKVAPQLRSVEMADGVESAVEKIKLYQPDVVFLDIHLADGKSFEIFKQIETNVPIIFTTAYDQYALKAFEVYSIDYLLKPIDKEKLLRSLDRYEKMIEVFV